MTVTFKGLRYTVANIDTPNNLIRIMRYNDREQVTVYNLNPLQEPELVFDASQINYLEHYGHLRLTDPFREDPVIDTEN